jgi:tyrosyl-DNA phosphodiesterase-1
LAFTVISAIAASLAAFRQEAARPKRADHASDRGADEEKRFQEELQRAIEASKEGTRQETSTAIRAEKAMFSETSSREGSAPLPEGSKSIASDFLRQRALLEKERLERSRGIVSVSVPAAVSGKKRSISESQSDDDDDSEDVRPAKRHSRPQ